MRTWTLHNARRTLTCATLLALLSGILGGCSNEEIGADTLTRATDWREFSTIADFSSMSGVNFEPRFAGTTSGVGESATHTPTPFEEGGAYFEHLDNEPVMYRSSAEVCDRCWVVAEVATRRKGASVDEFLSVIRDPDNPSNSVLRLTTKEHTDGVILRSRMPLPENYRLSLRIGYVDYGSEHSLNGYDSGDERALPWINRSAVQQNGVYWLAIMDTQPTPHNNIWGHHHRKFFMDAWNTKDRMYGVTVAGVDGLADTHPIYGKSFITFDGTGWKAKSLDPAFKYRLFQWYEVSLTRQADTFSFEVRGRFGDSEQEIVRGQINGREGCFFHYNRSAKNIDEKCLTGEGVRVGALVYPSWPDDGAYPDYFMMGDPHINYYEGAVLIDDLTLEIL